MTNTKNGGVDDALKRMVAKLVLSGSYASNIATFGAIVALCAWVLNYVPNESSQAVFFRWGIAITGAFAGMALLFLAILDLLLGIKTQQKSEQEQQKSEQERQKPEQKQHAR